MTEIHRSGWPFPHLCLPAVFRLATLPRAIPMKTRTKATFLAVLAVGLLVPTLAGAAMIGIYRNGLDTLAQRSQLIKLSGSECARSGIPGGLRIIVGKRTDACALRTPVVGRDLEIVTEQRLLSGTPKKLQHKAFLGVELRAGGDGKYQLRVFPRQRKVQLLKVTPDRTRYVAIAKGVETVGGINKMNSIRLRATNVTEGPDKGQTTLIGLIGNEAVVEATDRAGGELKGRASAVVVGVAGNNGNGVVAKVERIVIRVPSPF